MESAPESAPPLELGGTLDCEFGDVRFRLTEDAGGPVLDFQGFRPAFRVVRAARHGRGGFPRMPSWLSIRPFQVRIRRRPVAQVSCNAGKIRVRYSPIRFLFG